MIIWPAIIVIGCIVGIFLGHKFVYGLCRHLNLIGSLSEQEKKVARYIGYFERFIYVLLICFEQWSAMSFVLTARAIVRYKAEHSNYILLGVFANVSFSLFIGTLCLIARAILQNRGIFSLLIK